MESKNEVESENHPKSFILGPKTYSFPKSMTFVIKISPRKNNIFYPFFLQERSRSETFISGLFFLFLIFFGTPIWSHIFEKQKKIKMQFFDFSQLWYHWDYLSVLGTQRRFRFPFQVSSKTWPTSETFISEVFSLNFMFPIPGSDSLPTPKT